MLFRCFGSSGSVIRSDEWEAEEAVEVELAQEMDEKELLRVE